MTFDLGRWQPATGGGGAPTMAEAFDAAMEAQRLVANRGSRLLSLERAYDEAADTIFSVTHQRLLNPVRAPTGPSSMQGFGDGLGGEDAHAAWTRQVAELRTRFPDKAQFFKTADEIAAAAAGKRREAEEAGADVSARSGPTRLPAEFAGSMAGYLRDPGQAIEVLATGWIGFGKTLLWNAIGNGAVNATSDALSQPLIQAWRKEAGLDYGVGHAASSVAMSAVFGAGLDAGVRGAARGLGARRARLRGEDISVREAILEGVTPREQLERAARARPDGDVLRRAAEGDEAAQVEVARTMGLDRTDPEVRGAIQAIEAERDLGPQRPAEAVAEADHLAAAAQALRHALDGEAPPRAPEMAAPDPAARARLDAAPTVLDAARILRESPGALADHPMADSEFMRTARGLARTSDELAAAVEAGRVRADHAALVGHVVGDETSHLRLAEALHRAEPANEAEARRLLSAALERPAPAEARDVIASPEHPARMLSTERGQVLAAAMPDLLADPRLKGLLGDDAAATIAGLAAIRGPVSDALTRAAEAVKAGGDAKATARALSSRIAGLIEDRGLASLAEGDGRVLSHTPMEDPTGAHAKAQIESLERMVQWGEDAGQTQTASPPFSLRDNAYALQPAAARDLPAIRAEIDKAAKMLPADVRVRVEERLAFGGREIGGRYDIAERIVYASLAAADPARVVRHETIHALKASGLLEPGEYEILRRHAEGADLRKSYNIDDRYEAAYGAKLEELKAAARDAKTASNEEKAARQADIARETDRVEALLWEETVAEMLADHKAGRTFSGPVDRILKTISEFLERVRNALAGRGFKSVEDVFGAIERGDVARRRGRATDAAGRRFSVAEFPQRGGRSAADRLRLAENDLIAKVGSGEHAARAGQSMFDELSDSYGIKVMADNWPKDQAAAAQMLVSLSRGLRMAEEALAAHQGTANANAPVLTMRERIWKPLYVYLDEPLSRWFDPEVDSGGKGWESAFGIDRSSTPEKIASFLAENGIYRRSADQRFSIPDEGAQAAVDREYRKAMEDARVNHGGDTNKVDWSEYLAAVDVLQGRSKRPVARDRIDNPKNRIIEEEIKDRISALTPDQMAALSKDLVLFVNELTPDGVIRGIAKERLRRSHAASKGYSATLGYDGGGWQAPDPAERARVMAEANDLFAQKVDDAVAAVLGRDVSGAAEEWRQVAELELRDVIDGSDDPVPVVARTPSPDPRLNALDEQAIRSVAQQLNVSLTEVSPDGLHRAIAQERVRISHAASKGAGAAAARGAWGGGDHAVDRGASASAKKMFDARVDAVLGGLTSDQRFSIPDEAALSPRQAYDEAEGMLRQHEMIGWCK